MSKQKILYFDIDGVFLNYDDDPKPRLTGGVIPSLLDSLGFDRIVCVSSWTDLVAEALRIRWTPAEHLPEAMVLGVHARIASVFPDFEWFRLRVELAHGNDERGRHIDLDQDWYYCDDWADKFFSEAHSKTLYEAELGRRIHLSDPHDDGTGLISWLGSVNRSDES